uniref:sulfite oxidase n=1 Tax=Panagrolaimus davidi TaxID=227884 RepID=A0A914PIX6_9BILA
MFSKPLRSLLNTTTKQTKLYQRSYHHQTNKTFTNDSIKKRLFIGAAAALTTGSVLIYFGNDLNIIQRAEAKVAVVGKKEKEKTGEKFVPPTRNDLPTFKLDEIKKHGKESGKIWVIYKHGVYDVTEFHKNHPGGDKILLAAGGSVEPYWALYAQHKTDEVMEILETLRIGNLDEKELDKLTQSQKKDSNDPYANDPNRHPALKVNQETPFNAESPTSLLMDHFLTPAEIFFVRNHMPVPDINEKDHRLNVEGLSIKKPLVLSVDQLKKDFEETSVTTAIQCAGNRRSDMNKYKKVQGLMWEGTAMGNAKWTGVRLRDVLIKAGVDPNDKRIKHVHFEGADHDPEGSHYGGSIPFEKAMKSECLIAYKMNDEIIPRDHGFPLRLIAPGI